MYIYVYFRTCICAIGEPQASEGGKEQQSCDVQEVQSRGATRHPDKVLRDY